MDHNSDMEACQIYCISKNNRICKFYYVAKFFKYSYYLTIILCMFWYDILSYIYIFIRWLRNVKHNQDEFDRHVVKWPCIGHGCYPIHYFCLWRSCWFWMCMLLPEKISRSTSTQERMCQMSANWYGRNGEPY